MNYNDFIEKHYDHHHLQADLPYGIASDGLIEISCRCCDLHVVLNLWQDNTRHVEIIDEGDCWVEEEE